MINVTLYKNASGIYNGFQISGHAGYADRGNDIICSAVSMISINTINSIEKFTDDRFDVSSDEKSGFIKYHLTETVSHESELLLNSFVLGLEAISGQYGDKYIRINYGNTM